MAQRAIIGINGELTPFDASLDKIRTPGIGVSSVTWVPDADTRCTTLRVTANGTYNAAQRGDYGYDYVTVSVPGTSVTGRDPDTGEEVQVGVDPDTGDIVETVLATEIRVTTPPTKISYVNGETIDYSGIVVHAYSATGQDMGEVPYSELVFPVTTAHADGDTWTDGQGLNAMMLYYTPQYYHYGEETREYVCYVHTPAIGSYQGKYGALPASLGQNSSPGTVLITKYNGYPYGAGVGGSYGVDLYAYSQGADTGYGTIYGWHRVGSTSQTEEGRFSSVPWPGNITEVPESTVNPTTVDPTTLHAVQSLPVQWSRTGDGAVLETAFDIQVTPAGGDTP